MKTYIRKILITSFIGLFFLACEKEEIPVFSGKDVIYFQWAKDGKDFSSIVIDSLFVSFAYDLPNVMDSLIKVPVKIQGYLSSQDRNVKVQVMEGSTAKQGIHFEMPDLVVVPANKAIGYVPITLNRTVSMKDQVFSLKLQLLRNEDFEVNLYGEKKSFNSDRLLSYTQFELTISDILLEPESWSTLEPWLGPFSSKKLYLLAEVNEIPVPNYSTLPNLGDFLGHISVLKAYLAKQKNEGTPVLEDDGTEMILGKYA